MPEQPIRRRSPLSVFLSFAILVTLIVLLAGFVSGWFNSPFQFDSRDTYISAIMNESENGNKKPRLLSASAVSIDQTVTTITGRVSQNGRVSNYIFRIDYHEFREPTQTYEYLDYDTDSKKTLTNTCVHNLLLDKHEKHIDDPSTYQDKFIYYPDGTAYETSWWDAWGPTLIMLGGSILIVVLLFSRLSGSLGATNNKALEFNKSRARRATSKFKFTDVAGCEEEKTEMKELVDYLKEPKKYSQFGAKLPKGVLLVGPPGCGKTLLAKAVAGEAGVPFFSISGSDFVEMFVGVGAGRVRDMFKTAKENAPCLVFIDEIDAVGRQRGAGLGGGNDEREQTLNQLLVEMDGFSDNSGIIVIAATNRDDVLDPALLRAGRFDRKITVSLPDRDGREAIFKVHARNKVVAGEVDYRALAKRTVGFSGADIENIMNEAAILAVRKKENEISVDDIDEAIDRRIAGPAKSSRSLNAHEREIVAYHEAGHAIIGLKYPHSDKVQKITIVPRGNTGGHVRMTPEEDRFLLTKRELEARIVGYLGGRSSEETFFDDVSTGAQNDIEMATQIARMMVTELGMSSLGPIQYERDTGSVFLGRDYTNSQKNFSHETAGKIDVEVHKIIDSAHDEARKIIKENKEDVILIAKTLLEHEQITAEEIDYLLEHRHLKRDEKKVETPVVETPTTPVEEVKQVKASPEKKAPSKKAPAKNKAE